MAPRDANLPSGESSPSRRPKPAKPARAGWRSSSTAPQRYEPAAASRSWWNARRVEPARNVGPRVKLAVSMLLLAGLVGGFIYFLQKSTKVPLVVLAAMYRTSALVPPNSWTLEDFERFETQFADIGTGGRSLFAEASPGEVHVFRASDDWGAGAAGTPDRALIELEEHLSNVVPGGPDRDVVLIYISAHGVVNKQGKPCLLLEGSSPFDEDTWLPLEQLCKKICESEPQGDVKKVLVLDSNRVEFNGSCGVLYNSFAERTADLVTKSLDKTEYKNLVVLNSTSPGQVGWAAPELGGSVFGYFFCQALSGGAGTGSELSLYELRDFLKAEVDAWVLEHRHGRQTPMDPLFVDPALDRDFQVATCNSSGPTKSSRQAQLQQLAEAYRRWHDADWDAIAGLWRQHDNLKGTRYYSVDPLGWARIERGLLRLEQLLLAGKAYGKKAEKLLADLDALVNAAVERRGELPAYSLPLAAQSAAASDKDIPPSTAKTAEGPLLSSSESAAPNGYYRQANESWALLVNRNAITPQLVSDTLKKIKAPSDKQGAGFVELHLLRMLARYGEEPAGKLDRLYSLAVKSRALAEQAAAPDDSRAQYWIAPAVDEADNLRRGAEDLLFVGPGAAQVADFERYEKEQWELALTGHGNAKRLADEVSRAFDLRDRALSQAPYLAQWLWAGRIAWRDSSPGSAQATAVQLTQEEAQEQWETLTRVIERLQALSTALDESLPSGGTAWQAQGKELDDELRLLTETFDNQCSKLADASRHQESLVEIQRHLALPLVAASDRETLRQKHQDILQHTYENERKRLESDAPYDPRNRAERTGELVAPSDPLDGAGSHPLVELVKGKVERQGAANATPQDDQRKTSWKTHRDALDRQGSQLREALAKLDGNVDELQKTSREVLKLQQKLLEQNSDFARKPLARAKIAEIRGPRSQADLGVRAAAALCDLEATFDAPGELRRFDLHEFALWQCRRTLDDFWGPAEPGGRNYFEVVAGDYMRAAEDLLVEGDAAALRAYTKNLYDRRKQAAQKLLTVASADDLIVGNDEATWVELPLSITRPGDDLPTGIAAAFVRYADSARDRQVALAAKGPGQASQGRGESPAAPIRRIGVPIDHELARRDIGVVEQKPDAEKVDYWFETKANRRPALEAVAFYRGHERASALVVSEPGAQIVYEPKVPPPPSVKVHGDERVPTSVMFIFDCSYSMVKEDFRQGDGRTVTRLNGARDTLTSILRNPSLRQFRGVGLRIYGHRFGQDPKGDTYLSRYAKAQEKTALAQGRPYAKLHPGADVELTYPINTFDDRRRDEMIATLDSLEPWGFTPLYLAVSEAVNDPRAPDERRRIIVITDGFNQQGSPPVDQQRTARRLEQEFRPDPRITLDIIGFGDEIARDAREKPQDREDMKRIANDRGGRYYEAATAADLLDSIRKSLSLGKFEVAAAGTSPNEQIERYELESGTWHEPAGLREGAQSARKLKYDVRVVEIDSNQRPDMPVVLEGGEAIELFLERLNDRPTLVYRYLYKNNWLDVRALDRNALERRLDSLGRVAPPRDAPGRGADRYWAVASPIPKWDDQLKLARFFIQIQNYDVTKFSPRPAEAWIEITPVQDNGEDGPLKYRFSDLDFYSGTPLPRLSCEAAKFPYTTCKRARIALWFKMEPGGASTVKSLTVKELTQRSESVDGVGVSAEIQRPAPEADTIVEIRELRGEGAAEKFEPGRVKIEIVPPPKRVEHEYEARRHRFYFDKSDDVANFKVRLSSVEQFKKEAIACSLPEVELTK